MIKKAHVCLSSSYHVQKPRLHQAVKEFRFILPKQVPRTNWGSNRPGNIDLKALSLSPAFNYCRLICLQNKISLCVYQNVNVHHQLEVHLRFSNSGEVT